MDCFLYLLQFLNWIRPNETFLYFDGNLYLRLRTMSHTIYAAKFEQTIIHQHVHLRRESQSHAPAHVLMRLYPIDKIQTQIICLSKCYHHIVFKIIKLYWKYNVKLHLIVPLLVQISSKSNKNWLLNNVTGWLGIRIMCPSGWTYLHSDCCFIEIDL
jgi:hypothetical protein